MNTKNKQTLDTTHPELAAQWHPTKNGDLLPSMVTCGSNKKVWWIQHHNDPETGTHYEFEWQATVMDRARGAGCPYLAGNAVWSGYNDLATKFPEIAAQWHPTKNGDLRPTDVSYGSKRKVWWIQSHDDPETGKHFDFEWRASPNSRVCGNGCPYLAGQGVWSGYNDLATRYPNVAAEWHPTKNGDLLPSEISYASNKKCWWLKKYNDPVMGTFEFEWQAKVVNRTLLGEDCPFIGNDKVWVGYNDLETRFPDIAAEWHPTKNGALTPRDVVYGSSKRVWWLRRENDDCFAFEWRAPINIRTGAGTNDGHQTGCPFLAPNPKMMKGFNDLETCCPEVAAEWHPTKNRNLTPDSIFKQSGKKVWWKCSKCGQEWYTSVKSRAVDGTGCPACRKKIYYV